MSSKFQQAQFASAYCLLCLMLLWVAGGIAMDRGASTSGPTVDRFRCESGFLVDKTEENRYKYYQHNFHFCLCILTPYSQDIIPPWSPRNGLLFFVAKSELPRFTEFMRALENVKLDSKTTTLIYGFVYSTQAK